MHFFLKMFAIFGLAGAPLISGQTAQNTAQCDDSAFATAEKLRHQEGPNAFGMALGLYQEALRCANSERKDKRAEILLNIGRMQARLEHTKEAFASLSSALEIFQQISDPTPETGQMEAAVLINLAYVLQSQGEVDEALPRYEQALALFHALNDKMGEAYTLGELGRTTLLMGNNEAALSYDDRAIILRNSIDGGNIQNQRLKAATLDLTGRVHVRMNQNGLAWSYFRDALILAKATSYHTFIAYTLNDIGSLLLKENQPLLAERKHLEAKAELERYEPEDSNGIAESTALLADVQTAMGNHEQALENYRVALSLQHKSGDVIGEAQTQYAMGLFSSSTNGIKERLEFLHNAAELYHSVRHREGESQAQFEIAKILSGQGDLTQARMHLDSSIQLGEKIRDLTSGRAQRTSYFTSVERMYRFQIDLLLRGNPASPADQLLALDLMQRSQARSLVDALKLRTGNEAFAENTETSEKRDLLLRELSIKNSRLQWLLQSSSKPRLIEEALNAVELTEASLDREEAEARSHDPNLEFFSARVSVPEIQQNVLDEQSALIQFYLGDVSSYAWVITASRFNVVALPSRHKLEKDIRAILQFDADNGWTNGQQTALRNFRHKLAPLFTTAQGRRWIVVPDGPLHDFPFSLLAASSKRGLDHGPQEIVKIPSITAINIARKQIRSRQPAYTLAVFADPVFDPLDSRVVNTKSGLSRLAVSHYREGLQRGISLPRLLYSRKEMQMISRFAPQGKSKLFADFAAQASAASGEGLQDFKIIHFATHSLIDVNHPELSRIAFSQVSREGKPQTPGFLMLKDIYRMRLSSDLVVLSSCRGATGRQQAGEGPMSLSRAFLFAGSKAVLATLWEVDDEATAELMALFYKYMLEDKLPPISALKKAQDQFRHHPVARLQNPYYWAGFELYGDWTAR
jgi:CHAT domain-containing protein